MAVNLESSIQPPIAVSPEEWKQVATILKERLPNRNIWAFGSRTTGKHLKRISDLDLLIDGPPLTLLESGLIKDAFDQSPLPFKVDIVEPSSLTPEFQLRIHEDKLLLMALEESVDRAT